MITKNSDGSYTAEKIIFPSYNRHKKTAKEVNEILALEIQYLLAQNPTMEYDKCLDPIKMPDLSHVYVIKFKLKQTSKP